MYVCRATIQDSKNVKVIILGLFPDFWGKKSEKWLRFFGETCDFRCSTKI
jgi:hypothetical protein